MQNKERKNTYESLLPPVPESYRLRMEDTLAALPVDKARTASAVRFTKKQLIILIAALITLLTVGTALAVGISGISEVKNVGLEKLDEMIDYVSDTADPDAVAPDNTTESSGSIPIAVGMHDENGNWQPMRLSELHTSVKIDSLTVRLDSISYYLNDANPICIELFVESDADASYRFAAFRLSIDDAEPITGIPDGTECGTAISGEIYAISIDFHTERINPFRPDATFTLTFSLNGEPFTLTYTLTKEAFEGLRQTLLYEIDQYATMLNDIPDETIQVSAESNGTRIIDIAVRDHWLYYTYEPIPEYWAVHENGRDPLPYGSLDAGGFYTVIDGMLCPDEYISSKRTGEGIRDYTAMERVCLPYGDVLPEQSLVSLFGAIFRIEWATGKVTLPKDEAELLIWRQENEAISQYYGDYESNYVAKPGVKAETFTVSDIVYMNRTGLKGMIGIVLETETAVKKPFSGQDRQPVVTVNGTTLSGMNVEYGLTGRFEGGTEDGGRRVGFILYGPAYRTLPDTFEVTVTWNGSSTTFILQKSDLVRMYGGEDPAQAFHDDYGAVFGL